MIMISRRDLLAHTAKIAPFALVPMRSIGETIGDENEDYGVASGDPQPESVVLWTRIPPQFQKTITEVQCLVSKSPLFQTENIVRDISVVTDQVKDFTIRTIVDGLTPGTTYFYKFVTGTGYVSVTGRTKTAPHPDASATVRYAIVSCQDFTEGYFLPYEAICSGPFDFILHLGDFIYEKGGQGVRSDAIGDGEATTLAHYRAKYQLILTDPYLKEARRLFPFVHLWDDHEVANNYAGPDLGQTDPERMKNGYQAFFEYNPVPGAVSSLPTNPDIPFARMHRKLSFGKTLDLIALDLRQFRDPDVCGRDMITPRCAAALDPDRTMLGNAQRDWALSSVLNSSSHWRVLASELVMMPLRVPPVPFFNSSQNDVANADSFLTLDSWDGYPSERAWLMQQLKRSRVEDLVVCSGDVHNFYGGTIHEDPDDIRSAAVAAEITTGSVTSKGISEWLGRTGAGIVRRGIASRNRHIQFFDLVYHGHTEVEVTPSSITGRMIAYNSVQTESGQPFVLKTFNLNRGQTEFEFT